MGVGPRMMSNHNTIFFFAGWARNMATISLALLYSWGLCYTTRKGWCFSSKTGLADRR
jgi:hypothetical protein